MYSSISPNKNINDDLRIVPQKMMSKKREESSGVLQKQMLDKLGKTRNSIMGQMPKKLFRSSTKLLLNPVDSKLSPSKEEEGRQSSSRRAAVPAPQKNFFAMLDKNVKK